MLFPSCLPSLQRTSLTNEFPSMYTYSNSILGSCFEFDVNFRHNYTDVLTTALDNLTLPVHRFEKPNGCFQSTKLSNSCNSDVSNFVNKIEGVDNAFDKHSLYLFSLEFFSQNMTPITLIRPC